MAGSMVGDLAIEGRSEALYAKYINYEFAPFIGPRGKLFRTHQPLGVIPEDGRVAMSDHVGTGTGWDDDWTSGRFQGVDGMLCHMASLTPETCVIGWLATAGLPIRYMDIHASCLDGREYGLVSGRKKTIDEAGSEEMDELWFSQWSSLVY
jgi:hypothetical protein